MPPKKQKNNEKYHCRFYMQGSCKNGANCKFFHPVNANSGNAATQNKLEDSKQQISASFSNIDLNKQAELEKSECREGSMKIFKDLYFEKMINSMKIECYSCKNKAMPVYLSCGCSSLCEECVMKKKSCSLEHHQYDSQLYIK